jgi:hypothetical protein
MKRLRWVVESILWTRRVRDSTWRCDFREREFETRGAEYIHQMLQDIKKKKYDRNEHSLNSDCQKQTGIGSTFQVVSQTERAQWGRSHHTGDSSESLSTAIVMALDIHVPNHFNKLSTSGLRLRRGATAPPTPTKHRALTETKKTKVHSMSNESNVQCKNGWVNIWYKIFKMQGNARRLPIRPRYANMRGRPSRVRHP